MTADIRAERQAVLGRATALQHLAQPRRRAHVASPSRDSAADSDDSELYVRDWPAPLEEAAYVGVAGDIVRRIEPHSEADPVAILTQLLVAAGNAIGRAPHYLVEADRHGLNVNALLVGKTANGRKGTSLSHVRRMLLEADPDWSACVKSGLSSGEGLITSVQDAVQRVESDKDGSERTVVVAHGVSDKRLCVVESEFGRTLRVAARDGNTLTAVVREAWDSGDLSTLTKVSVRATGAHISIIGHITAVELSSLLRSTDVTNGFLNRFLIVCVRRSKSLPEGGSLDLRDLSDLTERLKHAISFGRGLGRLVRTDSARKLWYEEYDRLSDGPAGQLGAITSRGPAQVMRLACIYAVLERSHVVDESHLRAALALHGYVERSVSYLFGDRLGDSTADRILAALRNRPDGMTKTDIRSCFSNHIPSEETDRALSVLHESGHVTVASEPTGGRPRTLWRAQKALKATERKGKSLSALSALFAQENSLSGTSEAVVDGVIHLANGDQELTPERLATERARRARPFDGELDEQ